MQSAAQKIGAEPLAVLAFLCGISGLGLSFLKGKNSAIAAGGAGALAAIFLLALKSKLEGDALRQGGVIRVQYAAGYWVVLAMFLAAVLMISPLLQSRKAQIDLANPRREIPPR